ncbi:unnamed protein product [Echinostoma caproni]|uniref:Uncharacterized protein n=1 Tax=Echinostoma caproni TaxID=27848 RepID=A0A3P8KEW8_9TREM|nr:unnamed protein product [Echinostoma caproni]
MHLIADNLGWIKDERWYVLFLPPPSFLPTQFSFTSSSISLI